MELKIALVGIMVEDLNASVQVNALLHDIADKVLCRMGFPYRDYDVYLISVILHATSDEINALAGKLDSLPGVSVKTMITTSTQTSDTG